MTLDDIPENGTLNIAYEAGLGDAAMSYASLSSPTGVLLDLHRKRPDVQIRAVLNTVSDSLPDLFAGNPYLDEIDYHPWQSDIHRVRQEFGKGLPYLNDFYGELGLTPERMPFFLTPEEEEQARRIEVRPTVGLHLFAGTTEHNWYDRIGQAGAEAVITTILEAGFDVALLGGSSVRQEGFWVRVLTEAFDVPGDPRVHNLINRASVRLQARVASTAAALVGTMSCWVSLGTQFRRRSWVALPVSLRHWFDDPHGGVFRDLFLQGACLSWWDGRTFEEELIGLQHWLRPLGQRPEDTLRLVEREGVWLRRGYLEHDRHIVREVIDHDAYHVNGCTASAFNTVLDVGSHIGTFALHWHAKNPQAKIVCVEACPENIEALQKNVGSFAEVIQAACSYRPEELALLNSVRPGGGSTGGSTVVPLASLEAPPRQGGYAYHLDRRPLAKVTLEGAMALLGPGVDTVDMLKLDCEYSEIEILGGTPYPDRLRFIVGEYHDESAWSDLVRKRFRGWSYGVMSKSSTGMGTFHLANPFWPPLPKTGIREQMLNATAPGDKEFMDYGLLYYDHLFRKQREVGARRVVEVGTRAGYSALALFLAGAETVTGYDNESEMGGLALTGYAEHLLKDRAFQLVRQDTRTLESLPACDLVLVDGCHDHEAALHDLRLAAASGARDVLVDDCYPGGTVGRAAMRLLEGEEWVLVDAVRVGQDREVWHLRKERAPLRIAIPSGIGDAVWALTKIPALLKKTGATCAVIDACESSLPRTKEFLEAFDFVRSSGYCPVDCMRRPMTTPEGLYNYMPSQPDWHGYHWWLQANGHLEAGRRLEEWLPELETDWEVARKFNFRAEHLEAAEHFQKEVGTATALFFAASTGGNTTGGHNRNEIWKPADWAFLARECLGRGITPVFVGAAWDVDYYEHHLRPVLPKGVRSMINRWPIGLTFAFAKRCRFTVCYQSGLGIFSVYLGVPTVMWWRAKGDSVSRDAYVSFDEGMAHAWAPPGAVESGRYLPLVYGRESAAEVWEWIATLWLDTMSSGHMMSHSCPPQ